MNIINKTLLSCCFLLEQSCELTYGTPVRESGHSAGAPPLRNVVEKVCLEVGSILCHRIIDRIDSPTSPTSNGKFS